MNTIYIESQRRLPQRPQLKAVVVPIPLSGNRIALRRGTNVTSDLIIQDLESGPAFLCLHLMDGTRNTEAIAHEVALRDHTIEEQQVLRLIEDLNVCGVLDDVANNDGMRLTSEQRARYSRNLNCWSATIQDGRTADEVQRSLQNCHVLLLGVGGIGCGVAQNLAMLGCGHLTLIDYDRVELQNLNRQCLYETEAIGQFKVNVAADRIRQLNPEVNVLIRQTRVTQLIEILNLLDEFQPDILVLAADRPTVAIDRWTSEACFKRKIPYISGGVSGAVGRIWSKVPGRTGCFTCDELHSKELTPDLYEVARYRETYDIIPATSALSCGAQIVAGFMGYDILHSLLNRPMASAGQIISIDFATLGVNCTQRPPHPACPICGQGNHRLEGN